MKKQTDFRISQVKTFILLPNSKNSSNQKDAGRSEREQCNAIPLTCFHTARALGPRSWARQPWQGPTRGSVAPRGHTVSWPCCFPLLKTQPSWNQTREVSTHKDSSVWAHPRSPPSLINLFSFPFPILGELILTLVLWVLFCFTDPSAQGQLGSKRMKWRLHNCPVK